MKFRISILLMIFLTINGFAQNLFADLDLQYLEIINGVETGQSNKNGALAWGESYLLTSLLDMYEATEDMHYLDLFTSRSDVLFSTRDSDLGLLDYYRNKQMPAWGSSKYTKGHWMVWLGHTGMILRPVARFIRMVNEEPLKLREYKNKSILYLDFVKEAISSHQVQWKVKWGRGYYYLPAKHPFGFFFPKMAFNLSLSMGSVLTELYTAGLGDEYLNIIIDLAETFNGRLKFKKDGVVSWPYVPEWWSWKEDSSHAVVDLDFMFLCKRIGILFQEDETEAVSSSFFNNILQENGKISKSLDGQKEAYSGSLLYRWGELLKDRPETSPLLLYLDNYLKNDETKRDNTWANSYAVYRYIVSKNNED